MIIRLCPNCTGTWTAKGIIWSCDDEHPEVLAALQHDDPFTDPHNNGAGGLANGFSDHTHDRSSRKDSTTDEHNKH